MPEDPVVKSGRREATFAIALWLAAGIYTVTYCTHYGYDRAPGEMRFVLWFPDWVFWGIVVPWLTCTAISTWFAFAVMTDEPLASGIDRPPEDEPPAQPHAGQGPARELPP